MPTLFLTLLKIETAGFLAYSYALALYDKTSLFTYN